MAKAENIRRKQGVNTPIEVAILDDEGVAFSLTGATLPMLGGDIEDGLSPGQTPALLLSGTITDAGAGLIEFTVSEAARQLAVGQYNAEVQFLMNSGAELTKTETFVYEILPSIIPYEAP